jgi:hypothetical protein
MWSGANAKSETVTFLVKVEEVSKNTLSGACGIEKDFCDREKYERRSDAPDALDGKFRRRVGCC